MSVDNVIELRPKESGLRVPVCRKRRKFDECRHSHSEIDAKQRALTCTDCGAALDPIQWILDWAGDKGELLRARFDEFGAAVKRLAAEKEALEREVRNLKAQKRRAQSGG